MWLSEPLVLLELGLKGVSGSASELGSPFRYLASLVTSQEKAMATHSSTLAWEILWT